MADDPELLAQELRDELAGLGVRSRDLDPRPGDAQRAEDDLARIVTTPPATAAGRSFGRRTARVAVVLVAAAGLAVALVVVRPFAGSDTASAATTPAILKIRDGGRSVLNQPSVPASDELRRLAGLAARKTPVTRGPVQLIERSSWFLTIDEATGKAPAKSVLVPVNSEQYFQADGTVRSIERRGSPLDSKGLVTDAEGSWNDVDPTTDETFDGPENGPDYADSLSDDPTELAEQLVPDPADCPRTMTTCLVLATTSLHYSYVIPPRLGSALLSMLARQTDIRFAGLTTDRIGRTADAFVVSAADRDRALILLVDPDTGVFLGSEEVLTKDSADLGLKAPAVVEFTAIQESKRIPESDVPDASTTTRF
ncbi:MAG: hypothetical protein ABW004_14205 [Aeromicrobium sp.]